jgi:SAM-dependent methyltransferase
MNRSPQVTEPTLPDPARAEEDRIRGAYAKRQKSARYSMVAPSQLFIIQELIRELIFLLNEYGLTALETKKILEIGCGAGFWLREFVQFGARPENVFVIDLLADRVAEARHLCPESVKFQCQSAASLSFPDASFDLILQATVFTSILDSTMKQRVASEMLRVVKEDGLILWYDYHVNNPYNPDVRGIKKREIHQIFPHCRIDLRRITLAPPLTRLIAPYSWLACYLLEKMPWLCTHYLGVIQKGTHNRV